MGRQRGGINMAIFIIRDKNGFKLGYLETTDSEIVEELIEEGVIKISRNYGINELADDLNASGLESGRVYPEEIFLNE